jgi:hypothetical protein
MIRWPLTKEYGSFMVSLGAQIVFKQPAGLGPMVNGNDWKRSGLACYTAGEARCLAWRAMATSIRVKPRLRWPLTS